MQGATETTTYVDDVFRADVLNGLHAVRKKVPCRWLYDDIGSQLFEKITVLPEYYPTRTELAILGKNASEIAAFIGSSAAILEYGAGAGIKTELIINALEDPRAYVPIDIAGDFLAQTVARIQKKYPALKVHPIASDFMADFTLPAEVTDGPRAAFFPGSTIGNLNVPEAGELLRKMRQHVGLQGSALIGVDLKKKVEILIAAYDDSAGITALFNLNILARINRELDANFSLKNFRHTIRWNIQESAIEMHLESVVDQVVTVGTANVHFQSGETVHTESSRKYDRESFEALCAANDWRVERTWTDEHQLFAVFGIRPL